MNSDIEQDSINTGLALFTIVAPPVMYLFEDFFLPGPAVDGQAKGCFGDERVAVDQLEG